MAKNARYLAVKALLKVNVGQGYSNLVLDGVLADSGLAPRDTAFAAALFYGVLERQITLDWCIGRYSKTPLAKLDPQVREILRLSLYQLLYMDTVPDRAAVAEGVALTRMFGKTSASGFVNGVLRSFLRDGKPAGEDPSLSWREQVSVGCSAPLWLVQKLEEAYGREDTRGILEASLGRPPVYLRVNTTRTTDLELMERLKEESIEAQPQTDLPHCLLAGETGDISQSEAYKAGLFHVQDKSSQLCCAALSPQPGQRVLDVCASPGGKTFTIAQRMENRGEVVSCDLHPHRVGLIGEGARRLGLSIVSPTQSDATQYQPQWGKFQRVLCDVPCSGLGIIRRKPEIKYKNPDSFAQLPEYQYKILETSANYLERDGVLVYSTCTLLPVENQQVVERFLREHPDFVPEPLPSELQRNGYCVTLLPHRGNTDGFFIATIRRK